MRQSDCELRRSATATFTLHTMPAFVTALAALFWTIGCMPASGVCDRVRAEESALEDAFKDFVADQALSDEEIDAIVLDEFAIELAIVLADEERFTIDASHPLDGSVPGTDDMRLNRDFLNGCWGRIEFETPFGIENAGEVAVKTAEALRIDLRDEAARTIRAYRLEGVDGMPCTEDDRPIARRTLGTITEVSDSRFTVLVDNAVSAGLENVGGGFDSPMLTLHEVGTIQAAVTIDTTFEVLFIVDDDHLVTTESSFDPDNPESNDLDLWVRFDCVR